MIEEARENYEEIYDEEEQDLDFDIVEGKRPFSSFEASSCLCVEKKNEFDDLQCNYILKTKGTDAEQCTKLWQEINNNQGASKCPVDPSQGPCGIPNHLDMYGSGAINGMEFEMFGSGEDTGNVTVKGLEQEKYTFLKKWIETEVAKNIQEVSRQGKENFLRWNGMIPKEISKVIRDNCKTLKFSIERGGTLVEFKGLTFEVRKIDDNRRRLLSYSRRSC
eukprot:g1061.t1